MAGFNLFIAITQFFSYKINRENYPTFHTIIFFCLNLLQFFLSTLSLTTFIMLILNACERFDQLNNLLRFEYFTLTEFLSKEIKHMLFIFFFRKLVLEKKSKRLSIGLEKDNNVDFIKLVGRQYDLLTEIVEKINYCYTFPVFQ